MGSRAEEVRDRGCVTREPKIRELRVNDIRCHARGCGAGPGEPCKPGVVAIAAYSFPPGGGLLAHQVRIEEHTELVNAGWYWQEVNEIDVNPHRDRERGR